ADDQDFLWDILYVALWDAPGERRRPRSVLENPSIRKYVENWGRPHDYGILATNASQTRIGAIWSRLDGFEESDGYGCGFPCLGIGVLDSFQGIGLGTYLLQSFISGLRGRVDGLRLGVNPKNDRAIRLYDKAGFIQYAIGAGGYPQMKLSFNIVDQAGATNRIPDAKSQQNNDLEP
ncbi:MAG: GNAT family N-acetyltransferase, partial [Verrucomicrobiota bacterium]